MRLDLYPDLFCKCGAALVGGVLGGMRDNWAATHSRPGHQLLTRAQYFAQCSATMGADDPQEEGRSEKGDGGHS